MSFYSSASSSYPATPSRPLHPHEITANGTCMAVQIYGHEITDRAAMLRLALHLAQELHKIQTNNHTYDITLGYNPHRNRWEVVVQIPAQFSPPGTTEWLDAIRRRIFTVNLLRLSPAAWGHIVSVPIYEGDAGRKLLNWTVDYKFRTRIVVWELIPFVISRDGEEVVGDCGEWVRLFAAMRAAQWQGQERGEIDGESLEVRKARLWDSMTWDVLQRKLDPRIKQLD
ncbi:hypothetical protein BDV12DRAFT_201226 [Aspergillus spectabilis]